MRSALICFVALGGAFAGVAHAATTPSQVRVAVAPFASDPVWQTKGVKFEKAVECQVISAASRTPATPARTEILSSGSAKAPLFNPGNPQPNGTYAATPDDGFNTIFVPLNLAVDPNSYVGCRGMILANGQPMTLGTRGGLVVRSIVQLGATGPMTVSPQLDLARFAALPKIRSQGSLELRLRLQAPQLTDYRDFDAGTTSPSLTPGSDLHMAYPSSPSDNRAQLFARGPAQLSVGHLPLGTDPAAPYSLAACKSQSYSGGQREIVSASGYLCLKTSEGRFGAVRLKWENTSGTYSGGAAPYYIAMLDYVVWE